MPLFHGFIPFSKKPVNPLDKLWFFLYVKTCRSDKFKPNFLFINTANFLLLIPFTLFKKKSCCSSVNNFFSYLFLYCYLPLVIFWLVFILFILLNILSRVNFVFNISFFYLFNLFYV